MKIGIGIPNQVKNVRADVIPEFAARADEAGFSSLGTVGRIAYPGVMDNVALAAAAGATKRIGLITNVLLAPVWPAVLFAKEAASINEISGGRLTLGVGVGFREDDFVAESHGPRGRGRRHDRDLEIYHEVWDGNPVGGGTNAAVPAGTRKVPLLFGGGAPAVFDRMVKWGEGYVGASMPPHMVAGSFEQARTSWKNSGRSGDPRLVAITYVTLTDADKGRKNVYDYYKVFPEFADQIAQAVRTTPETVKEGISAFADIGADELILNVTTDNIDEVTRLAEIVL
jgi:alkanesulfonate monooxygenase SsuD/methylene tetrahydromethanopterin reductase-like flavin-dependent oxidoreductase (luciferase family)